MVECDFPGCGKIYSNRSNMLNHKKIFHESMSFKCVYCNHSSRNYGCNFLKNFKLNKRNFQLLSLNLIIVLGIKYHMYKFHLNLFPYSCSGKYLFLILKLVCGKKFPTQSNSIPHEKKCLFKFINKTNNNQNAG